MIVGSIGFRAVLLSGTIGVIAWHGMSDLASPRNEIEYDFPRAEAQENPPRHHGHKHHEQIVQNHWQAVEFHYDHASQLVVEFQAAFSLRSWKKGPMNPGHPFGPPRHRGRKGTMGRIRKILKADRSLYTVGARGAAGQIVLEERVEVQTVDVVEFIGEVASPKRD